MDALEELDGPVGSISSFLLLSLVPGDDSLGRSGVTLLKGSSCLFFFFLSFFSFADSFLSLDRLDFLSRSLSLSFFFSLRFTFGDSSALRQLSSAFSSSFPPSTTGGSTPRGILLPRISQSSSSASPGGAGKADVAPGPLLSTAAESWRSLTKFLSVPEPLQPLLLEDGGPVRGQQGFPQPEQRQARGASARQSDSRTKGVPRHTLRAQNYAETDLNSFLLPLAFNHMITY